MRSRISRHLRRILAAPAAGDAAERGALGPTAADEPPLPPPELSGRDYAVFLLRLAAEVEHGLMVQYLFTAYSLDGSELPDEERAEVRAWQETILGVAKEEMAHLVTVQNLLTALSGPLNFNREEFPHNTDLYPFVAFNLVPASLASIAAYVIAESPEGWGDVSPEEQREIEGAAQQGNGATVNRVGLLYAELRRVMADAALVPDADFDEGSFGFQASWDEWGRGYSEGARGTLDSSLPRVAQPELLIVRVGSREDALRALDEVSEQGEGLEPSEASHFERFLRIYAGMKAIGVENVVRPLAPNPTTDLEGPNVVQPGDPPPSREDDKPVLRATAITNHEARLWAHLFNVRYRKLLVSLSHAFELSDDPADAGTLSPRGSLIHRAFSEMYNLRAIAGRLVVLPVDDTSPATRFAGPPFQIPHTLMLPRDEAGRWRLHRDILDASGAMIAQLRDTAPASAHDYLAALAQLDAVERAQIEQLIAGVVPAGGGPTS